MPSHWNAFQWRESIRWRCTRSIEAAVHPSPISLLVCRRYPAPASPSLPRATLPSRLGSLDVLGPDVFWSREVSDASLVSSLDAVVLADKRAASHCHQDKLDFTLPLDDCTASLKAILRGVQWQPTLSQCLGGTTKTRFAIIWRSAQCIHSVSARLHMHL
ncbi:hypothetical protein EJB05_09121, partial [Eragrostis curvula]